MRPSKVDARPAEAGHFRRTETIHRPPAPGLSRFIRAYRFFDLDASLSYTVPAWTRNTMIFSYGDVFYGYSPDGRTVPFFGVSFLGPTTKPLIYGDIPGRFRFAVVEFHSLVMARLLREDMDHLADRMVDAELFLRKRRAEAILDELATADRDCVMADALDRLFLSFLPDSLEAPRESEVELLHRIRNDTGSFSMARLCEEIGHSERTLRRRFHAATGLSPQSYHVIQRGERVVSQLFYQAELPTHEISLACGFTDESHLIHDLRRLTGKTPGKIRRERKGGVAPLRDFFNPATPPKLPG